MFKCDYEKINGITKINHVITINDLEDKSDRTLLFGYTCERLTWHVYIKDEKIYAVIYNHPSSKDHFKKEIPIPYNVCYIPDKRLYPERCDFEFCKLLKEWGYDLPFTTWTENVLMRDYYGLLI